MQFTWLAAPGLLVAKPHTAVPDIGSAQPLRSHRPFGHLSHGLRARQSKWMETGKIVLRGSAPVLSPPRQLDPHTCGSLALPVALCGLFK